MALLNPAVQRCALAFNNTYSAEKQKGTNTYEARKAATASYRSLMPDLAGHDSICDFIACVTFAMLHEILLESHGAKLLYAAQVALGASRQPSKPSPSTPA